jgi:hypothetical protein
MRDHKLCDKLWPLVAILELSVYLLQQQQEEANFKQSLSLQKLP